MEMFFSKIAAVALLFFSLFSCSQTTIPLAVAPHLYTQDKVQAVDHWDTLANDLAARVQKAFEDRPDLIAKPLYIVPSVDGAFTRAYMSLLRTRLVTRGMQVLENYESGAVELAFTVQTVRFDSSRGDNGLGLASLGITIGGAIVGGYTTPSNHEIVISTTIVHQNRYVLSFAQICYINDPDWKLYFDAESLKDKGASADSVWKEYSRRGQAFSSTSRPYEMPVQRDYKEGYQGTFIPAYKTNIATSSLAPIPIIEEYIMPTGGKVIDPSSSPTPIGRAKR